jgi:signal transduction histidine kinase
MSLEMMRKMGGTLEAQGAPGEGAVFTVGVPIWEAQT